MNANLVSVVLALAAAPATAFQPSAAGRQASAISANLRDMVSYHDERMDMGMMPEQHQFESFDPNGSYSRSPQGGMGGRPGMMHGGGQGGGGGYGGPDRMYTQDGFDPFSAYGNSHGMSRSDRRGPGPRGGMDPYANGMQMRGGPGNRVKADDTMGGFAYSSRHTDYGYGGMGPSEYEYFGDGGIDDMMGGFEQGPGPMMGGGMDMDYGHGYPRQDQMGGGGYGGFDGPDMGQMGP